MSVSNRTYVCIICGEFKRAPLPNGLFMILPEQERVKRAHLLGEDHCPADLCVPLPYGHWKNWGVPKGYEFPKWLHHCEKPMFLLGKRAAQAATLISVEERIIWLSLGALVSEHTGKKRWRPILKKQNIHSSYPLV